MAETQEMSDEQKVELEELVETLSSIRGRRLFYRLLNLRKYLSEIAFRIEVVTFITAVSKYPDIPQNRADSSCRNPFKSGFF
jgi:hypothetical protein